MSAQGKLEILRLVEVSELPVKETLKHIGISSSTYYRWKKLYRKGGRDNLHDRKSASCPWNTLLAQEKDMIFEIATLYPEWSAREVSCFITDHKGFSVSESTVYRLLKKHGLIKDRESKTFSGGVSPQTVLHSHRKKNVSLYIITFIEMQYLKMPAGHRPVADRCYVHAGQRLGLVLPDFGAG